MLTSRIPLCGVNLHEPLGQDYLLGLRQAYETNPPEYCVSGRRQIPQKQASLQISGSPEIQYKFLCCRKRGAIKLAFTSILRFLIDFRTLAGKKSEHQTRFLPHYPPHCLYFLLLGVLHVNVCNLSVRCTCLQSYYLQDFFNYYICALLQSTSPFTDGKSADIISRKPHQNIYEHADLEHETFSLKFRSPVTASLPLIIDAFQYNR